MTQRDPLLVERNKTHGNFNVNAHISQALKAVVHSKVTGYDRMRPEHREVLDMICMKMSRILSGHAMFKDHWADLSGYSLLALEACDDTPEEVQKKHR